MNNKDFIYKIGIIVLGFFLVITGFSFLSNSNVGFGFNTMGELITNEAGNGGIGTTFYYPLEVTLLSMNHGHENHEVKIIMNDGFNNKEVFSENVGFDDGKANILIEVNPAQISIEHNVKITILVDGVNIGHIREHLVDIYSDYSKNTKYVINNEGKALGLDDLVTKKDFKKTINNIKTKLDNGTNNLLKKQDLNKFVLLQNGKINIEMLPFSMNNLTCNITNSDLEFLLDKGLITPEKKKKITLNKDCKDGMTDFHQLIQIVKAVNKDPEFLGINNPKGTYLP